VPPWTLLTDDPERSRWVRRGLLYQRMIDQAQASYQRNQAAKLRKGRG
jgi:hypothetical protein